MAGKSAQYISDAVQSRIESYENALRKHGIKRILGTLSELLDAKSLVGGSAAGFSVEAMFHDSFLALLAAGGTLLGRASVSLADVLLERRDIEFAHREIAYVHELSRIGT
jgi:hypothetical protein